MAKRKLTEHNWQQDPWLESLVSALCLQRSKQEMKVFLRDLATLPELQALSERLEVAKQLSKGSAYRKVAEITGASTTTVTRVAKFLTEGAGGYAKHFKVAQPEQVPLTHIEQLQERQTNNTSEQIAKHVPSVEKSGLRKFI